MKAIFASSENGAFGLDGGLPWPRIDEDMKFFQKTTQDSYIVMGRKTYDTLPKLKGRTPIVISNIAIPDVRSLPYNSNYLQYITDKPVFLIGGATLLTPELLKKCTSFYHTEVKGVYEADVYISDEVLDYMEQLEYKVILKTDKCTIKEYIVE